MVSEDQHQTIHFSQLLEVNVKRNIHVKSKFFFYSPTDAQVKCLKNNFKIYIKIDIKAAPTCFGAITIIRERII
jgi:hypothetical protein